MLSTTGRLCVVALFTSLAAAPLASAQNTRSWTGLASPNNGWTIVGNWDTGVPISGDTALFNGSGNSNTSISLGAAAQPIKTIRFDGAGATPYTLGVLGSGDKFNFDAAGTINVASNITALEIINAAIQANGALSVSNSGSNALALAGNINFASAGTLTVNNAVANTTTSITGNITDAIGSAGSLSLVATTAGNGNNNNFIISGTNTYTGPTTIQVNTGTSGSIQIGSDSPFGTGPVTLTLAGAIAPQFSAFSGTHTISNALTLNAGMTFTGSNSLVFGGSMTVVNAGLNGTRSFNNLITTAGKSVTLGANPGSSNIVLGNPLVNGGDGIGKGLVFTPNAGSTTIVNANMQDAGAGGGIASGNVQFAGSAGGVTQVNGQSTYTGTTLFNGNSTIKVGSSYNVGGTSGPFGLGTLNLNAQTNNIIMPVGGNRTLANPVTMTYGLTVANDAADTSSLTLAGPITMPSAGRFLTNNFSASGGTLTIGSAAAPSFVTLPSLSDETFTITGTGATVINSVIADPTPMPGIPATVSYSTSGPVSLNARNTYAGNTTMTGVSTVFRLGSSSDGFPGPNFTGGPFGRGTITTNSSSPPTFKPIGADRAISNAINMTYGFITANGTAGEDSTGPHNLSLDGPITLGANSRSITNNLSAGVALKIGDTVAPSTVSLGSTLNIQTQTAGGGLTIINSAINGVGGLTVQNGAVVHLNGANSYAGSTAVTGTGSPKLFVNGTKTGTGTITVDSVGTLGGSGSVAGNITNSGTISPGTSIGTLTALGNVTMNANSHLAIELSGGSADKLAVGGNLNLATVDFLDITGVGQGLSWVIATYTGTLTGTFNNVTPGYSVNYGTGTNSQITLNKAATGVNGDFNNDGTVDAGDYLVWRKNNGTNNVLLNSNGLSTPVGSAQYNLWRSNFGKPPGSSSGDLEGATIPEPTSLWMVLVALISLGTTCRRR